MKKLILALVLISIAIMSVPAYGDGDATGVNWVRGPNYDNQFWSWPNGAGIRWKNQVEQLLGGSRGTGSIFYVDSGVTTEGQGTSWDTAKDTIDEAIGLCTASNGDIILVAPGHAEAITAATSCVADVSGISIIGIGYGSATPTLTFTTAATALVSVTATNVRISNIKFVANYADVASQITLGAAADGSVIDNCIFTDTSTILNMLNCITVTADCDNIQLIGNRFDAVASATSDSAIEVAGGSDNSVIADNMIYGTFTDGGILASAAASTNLTVVDNVIGCIDAIAFDGNAGTTGLFGRNLLGANTTSIAAALTGVDAMFCWENYVTGALGASGIIFPAVDAD